MCDWLKKNKYIFIVISVLIVLYPLRLTFTGLDLWDSGYNCANFTDFGPEIMTPKLFYSTYLAALTGHIFTLLPFGNTYAGLRVYCSLVVSLNVLLSFIFCIRRLKINKWLVIAGELLAVSLCYNPATVLYNHLSFLLLDIAVMILYTGLTEDRDIYLAAAGAVLAVNVFARFPNIIQSALILAVWYYLYLKKRPFREILKKTLVCLIGYLAAASLMLAVIGYRHHGVNSYFDGIRALFAMTGEASEYTPLSMMVGMLDVYARGGRRLFDVLIFSLISALMAFAVTGSANGEGKERNDRRTITAVSAVVSAAMCCFFVLRKLMQFDFHHYATVLLTGAFFADILLLGAIVTVFNKKAGENERLISALMVILTAVLSVGSNTAISPVVNCLYIAGPYTFFILFKLFRELRMGVNIRDDIGPGLKRFMGVLSGTLPIVLAVAVSAFYIQCILFGASYCYQEAENGAGGRYTVSGSPKLKGIRMDKARADEIGRLAGHITGEGLEGSNVIIYGYCPGLAYYLDLEPAITPWPDLESYGIMEMEGDIGRLEAQMDAGSAEAPLIIMDNEHIQEQIDINPRKWELLTGFMKKYGYSSEYETEQYTVYRN